MPTDGQFIVAWTFEGTAWSGTFKYDNGRLFDIDVGDFADRETTEWLNQDDKNYFIAQEYKNANK